MKNNAWNERRWTMDDRRKIFFRPSSLVPHPSFPAFIVAFALPIILISCVYAETVTIERLPPLPADVELTEWEKTFSYRGKLGGFAVKPSRYGIFRDENVFYPQAQRPEGVKPSSIKMMYDKTDRKSFCGTYIMLMGDLSRYSTITFMIKGARGGEAFELGLNDIYSNRREDAVMSGSIFRYLPQGVTTEWQKAAVPITDFYGPDISKTYTLVFHHNETGKGAYWIDDMRFTSEHLANREEEIYSKGYLLLDDFDHNDLNLLGRKANTYKKLPSVCIAERVENPRVGDSGRSLELSHEKGSTGWCGYYTLLNQVDGEYYDLSRFKSASFMVKGEKGGETFQLGMADKNWINIGDSLKAGQLDKFLPGGITTQWQEVTVPLSAFGSLDLAEMGSFVIDFNKKQEGIIYIDDLKFILKSKEELLEEW